MKIIPKLLAASILAASIAFTLMPGSMDAQSSEPVKVYVNNYQAYNGVVVRHGLTFITLTDLKNLGEYQFQYNKNTKQVTIAGEDAKAVLTIGSKQISVNGKNQTIESAPFLDKEGKTMIPLRAVSQAFDAELVWNPSTRTVYIGKTTDEVLQRTKNASLSVARNAVLQLPRVSRLPAELELTYLESQNTYYYFPRNETNSFFIRDNDLVNYYKVTGGHAELLWQGKMDVSKQQNQSNIFFIKYTFSKEVGAQPDVSGTTFAEFIYAAPVGSVSYRLINKSGELSEFGTVDSKGGIVDIPQEN
ncbi:copper amine oxidase N-terminal domain-containing protein [Paenibacillus jiagnxiensis]|uniref:copper amine oxidase N-terminal domain-containing protein n=1 Tax=Paenibacillus jiagnxiensis TaxID=3228926 RepID=UPI0033A6BD01